MFTLIQAYIVSFYRLHWYKTLRIHTSICTLSYSQGSLQKIDHSRWGLDNFYQHYVPQGPHNPYLLLSFKLRREAKCPWQDTISLIQELTSHIGTIRELDISCNLGEPYKIENIALLMFHFFHTYLQIPNQILDHT